MKFYIPHYTPLIERKENIINQFKKYNITNYEFIEIYDRFKLSKSNLDKFENLKLSEISLFMKQMECLNRQQDDIICILEDDAIFCDNFNTKLEELFKELETIEKWDVIFAGACCNLHVENIIENKILYPVTTSRGLCMTIFNKGVGTKIFNLYLNEKLILMPSDHWFNNIQSQLNLNYFWSEPILVDQGSETGLFGSSLR